MTRRRKVQLILAADVGAILILNPPVPARFGRDYDRDLVNHYLLHDYDGESVISWRDYQVHQWGVLTTAIGNNVDLISVRGHLIIGHVGAPRDYQLRNIFESRQGYFIINTETHGVEGGLSGEKWLARLRELGVSTPARLWSPRRLWNIIDFDLN
jgi:hypothetical protein